jgi:hypothetical protein
MKALSRVVISTVTVVLSPFVCSQAAAQCPAGHPTSPTPHQVAVKLIDGQTPGICKYGSPKPTVSGSNFKILASNQGDTVTWTITNTCSRRVKFAIGQFTPHNTGQQVDYPLQEVFGSLVTDSIPPGGSQVLTAHTKTPLNHADRVCTWYNYNLEEIVSGGQRVVIGDPEIEIPR